MNVVLEFPTWHKRYEFQKTIDGKCEFREMDSPVELDWISAGNRLFEEEVHRWKLLGWKEVIPFGSSVNTSLNTCNHEWIPYTGLRENYSFCKLCDEKKYT